MFNRFNVIRNAIFIIVLFNIRISTAQGIFTFSEININDIEKIENHFNSVQTESESYLIITESVYPYAGKFNLAQPIVYLRRDTSFISDLQVEYYYSMEDSIVRLILYNWDYLTEAKKQDAEKYKKLTSHDKLSLYKYKFDSVFAYLKNILGDNTGGNKEVVSIDYDKDKKSNYVKLIWDKENIHTELWRIWVSGKSSIENLRVRVKIYLHS